MYFVTFLLKNLTRRKTRSALTVVGVAVAVGAMVTCLGIAHGLEESFVHNFEGRNSDLIVTAAGQVDQLRSDLPEDLEGRIAAIDGVADVRPGLLELVSVKKGDNDISVFINGWPTDSSLFNALTLLSGRQLAGDLVTVRAGEALPLAGGTGASAATGDYRMVMIGETLAANLGKQVGDAIQMQDESFTVVGVFRSFSVFENGSAILPLRESQRLMGREGRVTGFTVVLKDAPDRQAEGERVAHEIEQLRDDHGRPYRITARPARDYVKDSLPIKLAHGIAWFFSIFPALMGAVVMLITMLTSVLERVKEIGILRAMGWRKGRVVRMILGEALLLSLVGAALGCAVGAAVVRWLSTLTVTGSFVEGDVPPVVFVYGVLGAAVVALVGAAWPAWQAARWQPTEALRHE